MKNCCPFTDIGSTPTCLQLSMMLIQSQKAWAPSNESPHADLLIDGDSTEAVLN